MVSGIDSEIEWLNVLKQIKHKEVFFKPTKELSPYIFPILYGELNHPNVNSLLFRPFPSGYISLHIRFKSGLEVYDGNNSIASGNPLFNFVVGVQKLEKLHYIKTLGKVENFIINFKPGGFIKTFNIPACKVQNKVVDLIKLIKPRFYNELKQLEKLPSLNNKVSKLLEILSVMINESPVHTKMIAKDAAEKIMKYKGNVLLKEICEKSKICNRTLQRAFLSDVGTTPKEFLRITRFNNVLTHMLENNFENWHQIINDYGYYDQAHFIHDFKSVTGYSPNEFMFNGGKEIPIYLDRFGMIQFESENANSHHA